LPCGWYFPITSPVILAHLRGGRFERDQLVHSEKDTAMDGFNPSRISAARDPRSRHRVVEIRTPHLVFDIDRIRFLLLPPPSPPKASARGVSGADLGLANWLQIRGETLFYHAARKFRPQKSSQVFEPRAHICRKRRHDLAVLAFIRSRTGALGMACTSSALPRRRIGCRVAGALSDICAVLENL